MLFTLLKFMFAPNGEYNTFYSSSEKKICYCSRSRWKFASRRQQWYSYLSVVIRLICRRSIFVFGSKISESLKRIEWNAIPREEEIRTPFTQFKQFVTATMIISLTMCNITLVELSGNLSYENKLWCSRKIRSV